jgi:CheY-like chemotaxis protein
MENQANEQCVLIADDDVDDLFMIRQAFESLKLDKEIRSVGDGVELLDYLHKRGKYKDSPTPFPKVILLDLNMPKKDGRECLREIKSTPVLSKIPVIIFSTSANPDDITACYEMGASGYIMKPYSYKELLEIMETFKKYWFSTVKTPRASS